MSIETLSSTPDFTSSGTYSGEYIKPTGLNTLNQIYQPVKVYIEGVEVPYSSISINQVMKGLPSCELELPPSSGLMEIVRYYQPKIHIFYTDLDRGGDRLLFWGHICATAYSKSRSGNGYSSIRFRCNHRLKLANDMLIYFGNHMEGLDVKYEGASMAADDLTSTMAITRAFQGVTGPRTSADDKISPFNTKLDGADITKLPDNVASFEQRLIGMPGAMVNLWNQLKRASCKDPNHHLNMLSLYIPLFEEGLSYFKRMSGHYLVEKSQQDGRKQFCPKDDPNKYNVLVPSFYSSSSQSTAESFFAINVASTAVGAAGEMTGFLQLCDMFYESMLYETLTLASPAEVALDPTSPMGVTSNNMSTVETVVKPSTPFYYSPICNVVFPRMFESIDITQEEESVPTRVSAQHNQLPNQTTAIGSHYRGPNSVREALALGSYFNSAASGRTRYDLKSTTIMDPNVPGMYEQGRGMKPVQVSLPWWLVLVLKNYQTQGTPDRTWPSTSEPAYAEMLLRMKDWEQRFAISVDKEGKTVPNSDKKTLDPNSPISGINAYESMLYNSVDYEFTKTIASARQGTINCVFNPYIIPGYPMDVLDDSPNCPSFHGLCSSVTHNITANHISTTVGIVAAVSYSELSMYYMPPLHPSLMGQLGMYNETGGAKTPGQGIPAYGDTSSIGNVASTLLQNPQAKLKADEFYYSVLGVGAADPTELYDYQVSQPRPQLRGYGDYKLQVMPEASSIPDVNGGDLNDWNTVPGNLRLVSRNIEGKDSIAFKFQYSFIDMTEDNYSGSAVAYSNPVFMSPQLLEPGASMFLEYKDTIDFLTPIPPTAPATAG